MVCFSPGFLIFVFKFVFPVLCYQCYVKFLVHALDREKERVMLQMNIKSYQVDTVFFSFWVR